MRRVPSSEMRRLGVHHLGHHAMALPPEPRRRRKQCAHCAFRTVPLNPTDFGWACGRQIAAKSLLNSAANKWASPLYRYFAPLFKHARQVPGLQLLRLHPTGCLLMINSAGSPTRHLSRRPSLLAVGGIDGNVHRRHPGMRQAVNVNLWLRLQPDSRTTGSREL